jgi:tetratricopeptide (TPR) repeat protein
MAQSQPVCAIKGVRRVSSRNPTPARCPHCGYSGIHAGSRFCRNCGRLLPTATSSAPQISVNQEVGRVEGGKVVGVEMEQVEHVDIDQVGRVDIKMTPSEHAWRSLLRALTPRFLQTPADWAVFLLVVVLVIGSGFAAWLMVRTDFPTWLVALVGMGAVLECALLLWLRALQRAWASRTAPHRKPLAQRLALWTTLVALPLVVAGLVARHIIWPVQFAPQDFGIAVARFDPGALSERLVECQKVRRAIIQALEEAKQGKDEWAQVKAGRVGLARDSAAAVDWARRVGADVVIWGEVDPVSGKDVSMYFEVVATEDRGSSPTSPNIVPATRGFTHVPAAVNVPYIGIQARADQEAGILIGYCLGLEAYYRADYGAARRELEGIVGEVNKGAQDTELRAGEKEKMALAYFYLGRTYQRLGQFQQGERWLLRAQECAPQDPAIPLSIACGYHSLGYKDLMQQWAEQAVTLATALLVVHPDNRDVRYDRGLACALLGRYSDAIRDFDAILEKDPQEYYVAHLSSGQAYLATGNTSAAIERFEAAMHEAGPSDTKQGWARLYLGEAYEQAGDLARAGELYESAASLAPQVAWTHYAMARFLEKQGTAEGDAQAKQALLARAEESLTQMEACAYDKPWAWGVMAVFLRGQSRNLEAISYYERIRQERPGDTLARVYLAELYDETGQRDTARAEYEAAVALDPTSAYGQVSYCRALFIWGDYEQAKEHCCTVLRRDPTDCVGGFMLGRIHEATGEVALARQAYERILDPASPCTWLAEAAQDRMSSLASQPALTPGASSDQLPCESR